jgi:hypothetical protein
VHAQAAADPPPKQISLTEKQSATGWAPDEMLELVLCRIAHSPAEDGPAESPAQILVALLLRAKQLLEARGANEDAFARLRHELIVASIGFTRKLPLLPKVC